MSLSIQQRSVKESYIASIINGCSNCTGWLGLGNFGVCVFLFTSFSVKMVFERKVKEQ